MFVSYVRCLLFFVICVCTLCWFSHWPLGCWISALINKNLFHLNWTVKLFSIRRVKFCLLLLLLLLLLLYSFSLSHKRYIVHELLSNHWVSIVIVVNITIVNIKLFMLLMEAYNNSFFYCITYYCGSVLCRRVLFYSLWPHVVIFSVFWFNLSLWLN